MTAPGNGSDAPASAPDTGALLHDAQALYQILLRGVASLCGSESHLVGIATGGAWLAERLQADLQLPGSHGVLSSALHRDDFAQRGLSMREPTRLGFDVDGAHIVVIDDVLYTGRTIRAVVNELFDYGRPASIKLAVLVERDGRQIPIQADFAAARVSLPAGKSVSMRRADDGSLSVVIEDRA